MCFESLTGCLCLHKVQAEPQISQTDFPIMGKEKSPRNPESPKQDKPKVKHPKTHINQINNDQTQRTNIKSSKGETTNNTQGDSHKDNS